MTIEGYDEHQIAAICKEWKLGTPIDVNAFFDHADIPDDVKNRTVGGGPLGAGRTYADARRSLHERILIEVVKLHKRTKGA
jgi:hypothetical protein